jgi:hypothetical protein
MFMIELQCNNAYSYEKYLIFYFKVEDKYMVCPINKNNRIDLVPIFWETQEKTFDVGNRQFNEILASGGPWDFRGQLKTKTVSLNHYRVTGNREDPEQVPDFRNGFKHSGSPMSKVLQSIQAYLFRTYMNYIDKTGDNVVKKTSQVKEQCFMFDCQSY